jgi:Tol biopolymer transport system component
MRTMNRRILIGPAALALSLAVAAPPAPASAGGSAGGGQIVWTLADGFGQPGHLVIARADGSGQRDLTPATPDVGDIDAAISPEGGRVLFERDYADTSEVRIVRAAGGASTALGLPCSGDCIAVGRPTWFDDDTISWEQVNVGDQYPGGYVGVLFTGELHGTTVSHVRRLSPAGDEYEDSYARLTPDGQTVVFVRYQTTGAGDSAVFRMRRDGSHLAQLTPWELDADLPRISPATSGPTQGLVVWQSYGQGNPTGTSRDLATVPVWCASLAACTSAIRYVTHNGLGQGRASNPAWSPDGRRIAYAGRPSVADVNAQIVTLRYDGTDPRTVSTSPLFDFRPDWGPVDH